MRCEKCEGSGLHARAGDAHPKNSGIYFRDVPCYDCGGSGVAHCCDGLTAENDLEFEPSPDGEQADTKGAGD